MPTLEAADAFLAALEGAPAAYVNDLMVMDGAAIALARDNGLPVIVFSIEESGNLVKMLRGEARATVIEGSA